MRRIWKKALWPLALLAVLVWAYLQYNKRATVIHEVNSRPVHIDSIRK